MNSLQKTKLKLAGKSLLKVLVSPLYFILAVFVTLLTVGVILWSLNVELLGYILFEAPITFSEKISFFSYIYESIFTTYSSIQSVGLVVFAVLSGINTSLLVYVVRGKGFKDIPKKSGTGAMIFGVLSGGCIACGTSLLTPLLASVGATSTVLLGDIAGILIFIGSALLFYSIFRLSLIAASVLAKNKQIDK